MKNPLRVLAVIVILIALGIALYWVGLRQGRSQLEAERKNFSTQLEQTNSKLVSSEYNARLNQARFLLSRAALDLDQRNFGLAGNRLKEASSVLGNINPSAAGIDPVKFDSLRKEIAATDISVALNIEEQRGRILALSEQLEVLLPRPPPPAVSPAAKPTQAPAPAAPPAGQTAAPAPQPAPPAPGQTAAPQPPAK